MAKRALQSKTILPVLNTGKSDVEIGTKKKIETGAYIYIVSGNGSRSIHQEDCVQHCASNFSRAMQAAQNRGDVTGTVTRHTVWKIGI